MYSESLKTDSIDEPVNVINRKVIQAEQLPFQVLSTGKYHEGKQYSYCREGMDGYCFMLTVKGRGELVYRGQSAELREGDAVFCSSSIYARNHSIDDEWSFVFVNIKGAYCESYERLWNENGLYVIHLQKALVYQEIIQRISSRLNQPYISDELNICADITELLTKALDEKYALTQRYHERLYPSWVIEAANILSSVNSSIRVTELAARFYMDENHFIRKFKQYMGHSPKEYSMICRLEEAAALLRECELSVTEIAEHTGFASPSFFAKCFNKRYECTPSEYRDKLHIK